jgi:hypothetical protein
LLIFSMKGLTIGHNAIIGAGTALASSVQANAIVTGNPARVVGYLDTKRGGVTYRTVPPSGEAFPGQPGRDRDHVLLSNTAIDEPVSQPVTQWLEGHKPEVASQEDHVGPLRAEHQSGAELRSHISSLRRAIAA